MADPDQHDETEPMSATPDSPRMSVIIVTDAYATIREVVDLLAAQSVHERIELVLLTTDGEALRGEVDEDRGGIDRLAGIQIIEVPSLSPLAAARVVGISAARAPLVVIGETHTYPRPGWAEGLIRAHDRSWDVVTPAFDSANPEDGAWSWAAFLADYGSWGVGRPAGPITAWPGHNSAYDREALLEFGDRLEFALLRGDELWQGILGRGRRVYFEPEARIDHLNVARGGAWFRERILVGRVIAGSRAARWPIARRVAYALAAPAIAAVLIWRVLPALRWASRRHRLPAGTAPALFLGQCVRAASEMVTYITGSTDEDEVRMTDYEVRKIDYVGDKLDYTEAGT